VRIGVIGRSRLLLEAAAQVSRNGHQISFVHTCEAADYYDVGPDDFERLAIEHQAPFSCGKGTRGQLAALKATATDVAISVNWPTLLPPDLLCLFPYGILNAHAGDLPRYRGNACPNWALLNFERRIGVTIHRMVEDVDAGPILDKDFLEVGEETYIGDVYAWLEECVPRLFARSIEKLPTVGFVAQDESIRPLRTFPRRPEDSRINWNDGTRRILALVRASSRPFPGAFTHLEGREKIHILRAREFSPDYDFLAVPGQVCLRSPNGNPVVATGEGMIEIEECACEGYSEIEALRMVGKSLRARLI
jgi:methionyl-tRNA formyltransferase